VSLFPEKKQNKKMPKRIKDIRRLGSQRVLVKFGEISTVTLNYRGIDDDADAWASESRSSAWIGYSMFILTIAILVWGTL